MNPIKRIVFRYVLPYIGMFCCNKNKYVNVIYYHDIVKGKGYGSQQTNLELFKQQMQYIKDRGYTTLTFDELDKDSTYRPKTVLITFDDGWRSNYTEIFAYMKDMGIKYNIFLEAGNVGKKEEYLTWDMVREMKDSGIVGFGAHTYTHPDMSDIQKIDIDKEFRAANEKIQKETGIILKDFCYPFGKWSEESNAYIIENTDYTRIYTSNMLYSYKQDGKIIFGRSSINGDYPFGVFKHMLKGNYNIYDKLRG
jgi:peptidoglycan/xylan/chitin deacetylase (PgdA/CDA1 family)